MKLKFMAQNIKRGGHFTDDNLPEDRWPLIVDRVRTEKPDFLLLSEVVDWHRDGHRDVGRAMADFGMAATPIAPSTNGYPTLLMYNPATVGQWTHWNPDFGDQAIHGFGIASFDVGLPDPLTVVPVHLAPFSIDRALTEAALIATRGYRYGRYAVLGGDFNFPPAHGPEPDYSTMKPFNIQARTIMRDPNSSGPLQPDRRIGWKMEQSGYVDAMWDTYQRTGDKMLLQKTATDDRIDQFWVSQPMGAAIADCRRLDDVPGMPKVSDHSGLILEIDLDKVDTDYTWPQNG